MIFDLDGVLIHSMPLHTEAWRLYLQDIGIGIENLEARMHGKRNAELVEDLIGPDLAEDTVFEHGAAKERLWRKLMIERNIESTVSAASTRSSPAMRRFQRRSVRTPNRRISTLSWISSDFANTSASLLMGIRSNGRNPSPTFTSKPPNSSMPIPGTASCLRIRPPAPTPDVLLACAW